MDNKWVIDEYGYGDVVSRWVMDECECGDVVNRWVGCRDVVSRYENNKIIEPTILKMANA